MHNSNSHVTNGYIIEVRKAYECIWGYGLGLEHTSKSLNCEAESMLMLVCILELGITLWNRDTYHVYQYFYFVLLHYSPLSFLARLGQQHTPTRRKKKEEHRGHHPSQSRNEWRWSDETNSINYLLKAISKKHDSRYELLIRGGRHAQFFFLRKYHDARDHDCCINIDASSRPTKIQIVG